METTSVEGLAATAEEAARLGGAVLQEWIGKITAREKGKADLVTEADVASQHAIEALVRRRYPDHDFLGEEGPQNPPRTSPFRWIVDPLDGTTNYVHGMPGYCVSVAVEHEGVLQAAAIFDPWGQECFTALRGGGAKLNGKPMRTSKVEVVGDALVAASFSTQVDAQSLEMRLFVRAVEESQAVRRLGSAAINLAYVAAGRLDAYWALNTKVWDVAAGLLIVEEAGGVFSPWEHRDGSIPPRFVAAGTLLLHERLRAMLQAAAAE